MSEDYYSDDDYDQEYAEGYSAYKYDAHFKYSQESMDRMIQEGRLGHMKNRVAYA